MLNTIEQYISQNNYGEAIAECFRTNQSNLGMLIDLIVKSENNTKTKTVFENVIGEKKNNIEVVSAIDIVEDNPSLIEDDEQSLPIKTDKKIRVMMYCNWVSSQELCELWNKMSKGDYTWNNIQIVYKEPYDYIVVINAAPVTVDPSRTIVFHMEPNIPIRKDIWGHWSNLDETKFLYVGRHDKFYNNNEWHLSKTYSQLVSEPVVKNDKVAYILSTVLSDKYQDPGHIKRIEFVKFLESKGFPVHVYGGNKFKWNDYKGSPPSYKKDEAMFPYKYTFNVENFSKKGYVTEKLFDGILAETLTFYHGCINIKEYIDERAFVWLELSNFETDYLIIKNAIESNLWEERLPYIKEAKQKILNETQFFPRIEQIINNHIKKQH